MKKICTFLPILFLVFLLNGCSDSDNEVDSTTGSADTGTTQTSDISSYPDLAGHGILWKPVSDSNRNLAILLARSYGVPRISVLDANKNVIENGRFVYRSNPDRATYRFGRPGRSFPSPCLLQVGSKIFKVSNPAKRYE